MDAQTVSYSHGSVPNCLGVCNVSYDDELTVAIEAARSAGQAVRAHYDAQSAATYEKADGSPVTDADLAADRIIRTWLTGAFPNDAILTEEGVDDSARLITDRVWIVDPIDGTAQFIARTGQFDVLVALVVDGRPVVGVMFQPSTGLYLAATAGGGAIAGLGDRTTPLRLTPLEGVAPRILTSVWFGGPATLPLLNRVAGRLGSPAAANSEVGVVARSLIDRLPDLDLDGVTATEVRPTEPVDVICGVPLTGDGTMAWEWDFVASDIVVTEAGGAFTDCWGRLHRYNKPRPRNVGGFVMSVDPETHGRFLAALEPELGELVVADS